MCQNLKYSIMVEASMSRPWLMLILPPPYSRSRHLSTSNIFIMPRLDQSGSFLGPALTVLSANIEGFSTAKQQILVDLFLLQQKLNTSPLWCPLPAGDPPREQQQPPIHWDVLYWSMIAKPRTLQNKMNVLGTVFSFGWSIIYSGCMDTIRRS